MWPRGLWSWIEVDPRAGRDEDVSGGVRLSDCEYGWVYTHEDLVDKNLHSEPGQTPHPDVETNGWDEHGTALMGELCAVVNAYDMSGMVPNAAIYTYPEWTVKAGISSETITITKNVTLMSWGGTVTIGH